MKAATIESHYDYEPDFFIVCENEVSLLLITSLLNSNEDISITNINKIFALYKDTVLTLSNISKNEFSTLTHPNFILTNGEGLKVSEEEFDIEAGAHLAIFGMLGSRYFMDNATSSPQKDNHLQQHVYFNFLRDSRHKKLTLKNFLNAMLACEIPSKSLKNGIPILSSVEEIGFLSGIYNQSKFIKLVFDLKNGATSNVNKSSIIQQDQLSTNTLTIHCSQLYESPKECLIKIKGFLKSPTATTNKKTKEPNKNYLAESKIHTTNYQTDNTDVNKKKITQDLFRDPDFFISGPPRSGTSLLTVLLNNHPDLAIAQDTSVFTELKRTLIWLEQISNKNFKGNLSFSDFNNLTESYADVIMNKPVNFSSKEDTLLMSCFFTCLIRFHAIDFFIPDPRKDRGTGLKYLHHIDFQTALNHVHKSELPFKSIINYCINSIIQGEKITGRLHGEKTPSHILQSTFLRRLYPNAKFINIIRNPLGYVGSRHERFNVPIKGHCDYYKRNINSMIEDDGRSITVRYEDIIEQPDKVLNSLYDFLGIQKTCLSDNLDPGAYPKYVGKKIDKNRDKKNMDYLTDAMKTEVKHHLKDIFKLYYPHSL